MILVHNRSKRKRDSLARQWFLSGLVTVQQRL